MITFLISLLISTANPADVCFDAPDFKKHAEETKSSWVELDSDQRFFMIGFYLLDPNTPPGVPPGDKAVLLKKDGVEGGMILFLDGSKACDPMPIKQELIDLMMHLNTVRHIGTDN